MPQPRSGVCQAYVSPARGLLLHRKRLCECLGVHVCEPAVSVSMFLLPDEEKRRMPQRSPRCRVGHFDFSEEVVGRVHLSAPRWFLYHYFLFVFEVVLDILIFSLSFFSACLDRCFRMIASLVDCNINCFQKENVSLAIAMDCYCKICVP